MMSWQSESSMLQPPPQPQPQHGRAHAPHCPLCGPNRYDGSRFVEDPDRKPWQQNSKARGSSSSSRDMPLIGGLPLTYPRVKTPQVTVLDTSATGGGNSEYPYSMGEGNQDSPEPTSFGTIKSVRQLPVLSRVSPKDTSHAALHHPPCLPSH